MEPDNDNLDATTEGQIEHVFELLAPEYGEFPPCVVRAARAEAARMVGLPNQAWDLAKDMGG